MSWPELILGMILAGLPGYFAWKHQKAKTSAKEREMNFKQEVEQNEKKIMEQDLDGVVRDINELYRSRKP